ncbi:MAG: hypothetical protein QNL04_11035, partial [SAR324 cluster bacterium]|nr:hypothetical protein [SAR324 cluster bacterium]
MTFLHPEYLFALGLLAVLVALKVFGRQGASKLALSPRLKQNLVSGSKATPIRFYFLLLGLSLAI